ncbi:NUDIX hydrolase [Bosea sp. RAF48]|uniref:NUDIX hydrolase n=1 Tax=Bosea sp. RAF48 TaxID=3237480 RepID=UPI003F8F7A56
MDKKWTTQASRTVIKDRWINLRADDCFTPSGHEVAPFYVLDYPDWVHVVAITPSDELVLVRQYRHGASDFFLELPAGTVDATDTDPTQAASRELEEETGYRAADYRFVTSLYANPGNQTNRVHTYLALNAMPTGVRKLDAAEDGMTVHLMPVREMVSGLKDGLLPESLNVASLFMALAAAGRVSLS